MEIYLLILSLAILLLGIPIGNFLAKVTKEELNPGKKYFKILILISGLGAIVSLIFQKDSLLFTFLFIIIVTSRSLFYKRERINKNKISLVKKKK